MRIVHIITGLNDGGAEGALFRLATSKIEGVSQIVISLTNEGKYGALLRDKQVDVYSLNMPRGALTLNGVFKLYKIIKNIKPDITQTWMYHSDLIGGLIARLAGCNNVIWGIRHTDHHPTYTSFSTKVVTKLCAFFSYFIPKKIVSCSRRGVAVHSSLGYSLSKFIVIPNGYDLSNLCKKESNGLAIRTEFGIQDDIPLLGMVGRWDPQKDHLNLLLALSKVVKKHPSMKCFLVGTNCDRRNLKLVKSIESLGLDDVAILLGRRTDVPSIMSAIDIHILSSAYGEAFPNVVAEAMACETPCVVTDVGDSSYIVEETGWIVKPNNPDELAMAVEAAISEKQDEYDNWLTRCYNSRQRITDNFSLDGTVNKYIQLWSSVLV